MTNGPHGSTAPDKEYIDSIYGVEKTNTNQSKEMEEFDRLLKSFPTATKTFQDINVIKSFITANFVPRSKYSKLMKELRWLENHTRPNYKSL